MRVHLHVVHARRGVAVARGRVRVVAIRLVKESGCLGIVVVVVVMLIGSGSGGIVVLEADGFVRRVAARGAGAQGAGFLRGGGVGKIRGKGWVVGVGEGGGRARGGEAVELGGQVVELFLQSRESVGEGGGSSVL